MENLSTLCFLFLSLQILSSKVKWKCLSAPMLMKIFTKNSSHLVSFCSVCLVRIQSQEHRELLLRLLIIDVRDDFLRSTAFSSSLWRLFIASYARKNKNKSFDIRCGFMFTYLPIASVTDIICFIIKVNSKSQSFKCKN